MLGLPRPAPALHCQSFGNERRSEIIKQEEGPALLKGFVLLGRYAISHRGQGQRLAPGGELEERRVEMRPR